MLPLPLPVPLSGPVKWPAAAMPSAKLTQWIPIVRSKENRSQNWAHILRGLKPCIDWHKAKISNKAKNNSYMSALHAGSSVSGSACLIDKAEQVTNTRDI